ISPSPISPISHHSGESLRAPMMTPVYPATSRTFAGRRSAIGASVCRCDGGAFGISFRVNAGLLYTHALLAVPMTPFFHECFPPALRILPRRFEGGGGFVHGRGHCRLPADVAQDLRRQSRALDQVSHSRLRLPLRWRRL